MKSKLVFRILGALASALIIASVFIPFVSVTGYSQSLWETHSAVGTIYLPIMIIVFGAVGVLVFSTGFKTELAYASAGGLLFFLIMQTIPVIDQDLFNTLGVGYYSLAVGTLLIVIMAFICGLRVKQKVVKEVVVEEKKEESMIDQIDKLYNDQTSAPIETESNNLENIIQPLPVNALTSIPVENNISSEIIGENTVDELQSSQLENLNNVVEDVKPIPSFNNLESNVMIQEQALVPETPSQEVNAINPVVSEFATPEINSSNRVESVNPVVSEFTVSDTNTPSEVNSSNPVVSEFATPEINSSNRVESINSVVSEFTVSDTNTPSEVNSSNPVVSEFTQSLSEQSMFIPSNSESSNHVSEIPSQEQTNISSESMIQPLGSDKKIDVMADTNNTTSSNLDIFG